MAPPAAAPAASPIADSRPTSSGTNSRPGLVQNWPVPRVSEPAYPVATAAGRENAAPGRTTTGLTEPSSPKNGIGTGRSAQTRARARPPAVDPVNPAAAISGCRSSRSPASTPCTRLNVPAGAPAAASAPVTISAHTSEVTGWASCALTTTGHPAASADAMSPPTTENAKGKFDAANTATGPIGRLIRRRSGVTPAAGVTAVSRYPPSRTTAANSRSCPVARATSPVSRSPPSAVSVSAIAASSPFLASRASATASSASARRANADQAGSAAAAAETIASTSVSEVSATGSPTGSPVRGSNPWIIGSPAVDDPRLPGIGLGVPAAPGQEAEVAALVGLGDVLGVQGAVAPLELRLGGLPALAPLEHHPFGNV